jgi:hypothetical protein
MSSSYNPKERNERRLQLMKKKSKKKEQQQKEFLKNTLTSK